MRVDVLTTFPELFNAAAPGVLGVSIPARAIAAGRLEVSATNIRDFATDKHQKTDDRPFGGGPGMVMMCQPLWDAVQAVEARDSTPEVRPCTRILMTPQGSPLTQAMVEEFATKPRLLVLAGHYEGIDERVIEALAPVEVSIGDYVLSGGELAALVLIDAVARLLPGVLGHEESSVQDSFSTVDVPAEKRKRGGSSGSGGEAAAITPAAETPELPLAGRRLRLLDCPQYTKPREWMGRAVPEVLLSGDHQRIAAWRLEQRIARTRARRPDLLG
ncbi:MAG TPA: tRNA (guanosine(37)-N1)-methyltransferase TrmD [Phycisphaerales bacterium]|nr:tRNA (guanosine(37)-N1)-methyltransferase TrmD [Phycisphaerales bacterium]